MAEGCRTEPEPGLDNIGEWVRGWVRHPPSPLANCLLFRRTAAIRKAWPPFGGRFWAWGKIFDSENLRTTSTYYRRHPADRRSASSACRNRRSPKSACTSTSSSMMWTAPRGESNRSVGSASQTVTITNTTTPGGSWPTLRETSSALSRSQKPGRLTANRPEGGQRPRADSGSQITIITGHVGLAQVGRRPGRQYAIATLATGYVLLPVVPLWAFLVANLRLPCGWVCW